MTQNTFPKSQYVTKAEISLCRKFKTTWPNHILMWKWIQNCLFFLLHMKLNYIDASIGHALWLSNRIWVGVLCTVSKIDPWNFLYTIFHFPISLDVIQCAWKPKVWKTQNFKIKKKTTWFVNYYRGERHKLVRNTVLEFTWLINLTSVFEPL